jgi:thymidylate synthase (FAD)
MRTIKVIIPDDCEELPVSFEANGKTFNVWQSKYVNKLDHGFVGLKDFMGSDDSVPEAARTSYQSGTKRLNDDNGLIRYLMRHQHTTPFEMIEIKWHIKCPIFVSRQWVRHRTASINEASGRYSILDNEFYNPEFDDLQPQSKTNKQGREGVLSNNDRSTVLGIMDDIYTQTYDAYEYLLGENKLPHSNYLRNRKDLEGEVLERLAQARNNGVTVTAQMIHNEFDKLYFSLLDEDYPGLARETARNVLPVSLYTQFYWKSNLLNLFRFLSLRMDSHAQKEIRTYADTMFDLTKEIFPVTCQAFEDYWFYAVNLTRVESEVLFKHISSESLKLIEEELQGKVSKRELEEFRKKAAKNLPT